MKKVILVRGLPGSGKTTFAKRMCEDIQSKGESCVWLETSMYTEDTGEPIISPKQTPIVTGWLLRKVDSALNEVDNVIISRVSLDKNDINQFRDVADMHEAEFVVYRLDTHWEDKIPTGALELMKKDMIPYQREIVIS